MIRLFKENTEAYTELGNNIHDEFYRVIKVIFDKYSNIYSNRDMELIIHSIAGTISSESVLNNRFKSFNELEKALSIKIDVAANDLKLIAQIKDLAIKYFNGTYPEVLCNWSNCKIQAIKACRELTGLPLKQCQICIEKMFPEFNY